MECTPNSMPTICHRFRPTSSKPSLHTRFPLAGRHARNVQDSSPDVTDPGWFERSPDRFNDGWMDAIFSFAQKEGIVEGPEVQRSNRSISTRRSVRIFSRLEWLDLGFTPPSRRSSFNELERDKALGKIFAKRSTAFFGGQDFRHLGQDENGRRGKYVGKFRST